MSEIDYTKPVDPKSRAWCSEDECPWKHFGIWSHREALIHHEVQQHRVHLIVPDTEEQKEARRAKVAELEAEEEANREKLRGMLDLPMVCSWCGVPVVLDPDSLMPRRADSEPGDMSSAATWCRPNDLLSHTGKTESRVFPLHAAVPA